MWRLTNVFKEALRKRLCALYGEQPVDRLLERIALIAGRYNYLEERCSDEQPCWDQQSCVFITYGDMIRCEEEPGLATLERFAREYLHGLVTVIHLLPFFPSSSDGGFSVINYREVDPALGSWDNVEMLGQEFRLMVDLVLNHVSSRSKWFEDYRGAIAPARDYFIEVDPETDLSQVVRPRTSPLLTPVTTVKGEKHVWTTFSEDQIDLNYANPDVLLEMMDILLGYINRGAVIVRLDAIAYLWKEIGTPCINHPCTHQIVKLLRDLFEHITPGALLLTETNLPHAENVSYFGDGDEAHMVYQFSLAPLLLHTIHSGSAAHLTRWARSLSSPPPGCTFLNFTASHDGIGIRPLEGLLDPQEIDHLVAVVKQCGGYVSSRSGKGGEEVVYELNITYFDALQDPERSDDIPWHLHRFFCSQVIMLGLRGLPAVYFHSLVGGRNNAREVAETGIKRMVNRGRWKDDELRRLLNDPQSLNAMVYSRYAELLRRRSTLAAFHPDAVQEVFDGPESLFVLGRRTLSGSPLFCVHNVTGRAQLFDPGEVVGLGGTSTTFLDHLSDQTVTATVELEPYRCMWLEPLPEQTTG